ncbi:hypothetical protein Cadr_000011545 [Camelus dromedarius]|uniref:Uncharacterized protein n=1 Tax=Camelus dromedarius TaxID=9838 RepID=A0A5N4DTD6_CAMDR|nr:hypothetical protein Cadr_000011545 [Camelus dromedarius]
MEGEREPCIHLGEEHSRTRKQQMQRPAGRTWVLLPVWLARTQHVEGEGGEVRVATGQLPRDLGPNVRTWLSAEVNQRALIRLGFTGSLWLWRGWEQGDEKEAAVRAQAGRDEGRDSWNWDMILRSQERKPSKASLRTVDLSTSGQRRLGCQLRQGGDLALHLWTHCLLFRQLEEEGETRCLLAGPLAPIFPGSGMGDAEYRVAGDWDILDPVLRSLGVGNEVLPNSDSLEWSGLQGSLGVCGSPGEVPDPACWVVQEDLLEEGMTARGLISAGLLPRLCSRCQRWCPSRSVQILPVGNTSQTGMDLAMGPEQGRWAGCGKSGDSGGGHFLSFDRSAQYHRSAVPASDGALVSPSVT